MKPWSSTSAIMVASSTIRAPMSKTSFAAGRWKITLVGATKSSRDLLNNAALLPYWSTNARDWAGSSTTTAGKRHLLSLCRGSQSCGSRTLFFSDVPISACSTLSASGAGLAWPAVRPWTTCRRSLLTGLPSCPLQTGGQQFCISTYIVFADLMMTPLLGHKTLPRLGHDFALPYTRSPMGGYRQRLFELPVVAPGGDLYQRLRPRNGVSRRSRLAPRRCRA